MKNTNGKVAGKTIGEWERLSAELDEEDAGAEERTRPPSEEEQRWYRGAAGHAEQEDEVSK